MWSLLWTIPTDPAAADVFWYTALIVYPLGALLSPTIWLGFAAAAVLEWRRFHWAWQTLAILLGCVLYYGFWLGFGPPSPSAPPAALIIGTALGALVVGILVEIAVRLLRMIVKH